MTALEEEAVKALTGESQLDLTIVNEMLMKHRAKLESDQQIMEEVCREFGMSMSTAFTIFTKKMCRERRIPFEVSIDPFYSDSNMAYLARVTSEIDSGKAKPVLHELEEE